jgi:predicted DCC family thiol-disulfide oxidoreductase YuxK
MDKNGEIFEKSNAIRVITNQLILLQWIGLIIWLLPTSFTDHLYMAIAKHRYRVFGKYDSCPLVNNKKVVERLII